jgi:hypothetical protein
VRAQKVWRVAAYRADHDELDAARLGGAQPLFHRMLARAARGHLAVLQRKATEGKNQPRVARHARPVGDATGNRLVGADDVRQNELRRAPAVVADLVGAATAGEEKAPHLRARMVEASGGRPAVGAAENAAGPARGTHALELLGDEPQRLAPWHFHERIAPAPRAITLLEP